MKVVKIMNRNVNSHFANIPNIDISRSRFNRPFNVKTTIDAGQLVPFMWDEMLPGDTFNGTTSITARMATPIFAPMDNAFLDVYYFFIPNRLIWDHWKEFMGENTQSAWAPKVEYNVPQLQAKFLTGSSTEDVVGPLVGSIGDYLGLPLVKFGTGLDGAPEMSVSALPFRAYVEVWNEWFRDQNTMSPAYQYKGDATRFFALKQNSADDKYISDYANKHFDKCLQQAVDGGYCLPVSKFHDYFTSALPSPQKGDPVLLPLNGDAPVYTRDTSIVALSSNVPLRFNNSLLPGNGYSPLFVDNQSSSGTYSVGTLSTQSVSSDSSNFIGVVPENLWADLSQVSAATINELRLAFQVQKLLERDARGGSRYRELIKSHFGVTSPDARMQVPEYIGGKRIPINIDQVVQTSSTNTTSPQGNVSGYSLTNDVDNSFTFSSTEHGILLGLCCVRTYHTYQQGIEKSWSRKTRYDYYWPALANIGEQPIYNKELYIDDDMKNEEVFGYQEAWADYRYKPNRVTGGFRELSNKDYGLSSWHYADYYSTRPYLSSEWMAETSENIERTLAVSSDATGYPSQFLLDIFVGLDCYRPLPVYSIPGMIDHN